MTLRRFAPVTLLLLLGAVAAFVVLGPATNPGLYRTLPQHLVGVAQHGTLSHLALNMALIGFAGPTVEGRIGSARTAVLVTLTALAATALELVLGGPGFVGLSGVAYALVACAIVAGISPRHHRIAALLIAAVIAAEWLVLRDSVAVYAHATGAALGLGAFMFANLFGPKGPRLKPMEWSHVSQVIAIIEETDEDDAAEAEKTFLDTGYENMFVLMDGRTLMGVTGYGVDPDAPDLAWLSWTYLAQAFHGQGHGRTLINDLLGMLAKQGVRKIFIETSDYAEDGVCIYENAHRLYEDFGAALELTVPDYHAAGEAKLVYGLLNPEYPDMPTPEFGDKTGAALMGLDVAPETEDVASIRWEEIPEGLTGLDITLSQARERGFRLAVLALPQDLSDANAEALGKNFRHVGQLAEYYGPDFGQEWWVAPLATSA